MEIIYQYQKKFVLSPLDTCFGLSTLSYHKNFLLCSKHITISMDSNTSTPQQNCRDMSFSSEASDMDKWAKLLDQKLQPLHKKVDQVLSTSTHMNGLENEIKLLKIEN